MILRSQNAIFDSAFQIEVRTVKVMVATSGGGHWVEMRRLLRAFDGSNMLRRHGCRPDPRIFPARYHRIRNVNRNDPSALFCLLGRSPEW